MGRARGLNSYDISTGSRGANITMEPSDSKHDGEFLGW